MPIPFRKLDQLIYRFTVRLQNEKPFLLLLVLAALSVAIFESHHRHFFKSRHQQAAQRKIHKPIFAPEYFKYWRNCFLTLNEKTDSLGLVRGIFLGEDQCISQEIKSKFKQTGLYHLLSASGFNCWIVATAIGLLFQALSIPFCPLLSSTQFLYLKKWLKPMAKLFGAWLFWLWSNQSPPITRATVLISTLFFLELLILRGSFGRILFVQYLLSLILFPRLWHNASFQLTFGCLFGILIFANAFYSTRRKILISGHKYSAYFVTYFATNLGACIGALPTTWLVFREINFTSLLTNWFAIPIVSFGIMPLGLLQMLVLIPLPWEVGSGVAEFLGTVAALNADVLNWCLEFYLKYLPVLSYVD